MNERNIGKFFQVKGKLLGQITLLDEMTSREDCINNPDVPGIRSAVLTLEDSIIGAFDELESMFGMPELEPPTVREGQMVYYEKDGSVKPAGPKSILF